MIAELLEHESDSEHFPDRIARQHGVRSVKVMLAHGPDGEKYPRVGISTPGRYSSVGLREDGPTQLELFDEQVHDTRSGSTADVDERWIRTVVPSEWKSALFAIAHYRLEDPEIVTEGDVIRLAIETYLREHVDLRELPEDVRPDIDELPDFERSLERDVGALTDAALIGELEDRGFDVAYAEGPDGDVHPQQPDPRDVDVRGLISSLEDLAAEYDGFGPDEEGILGAQTPAEAYDRAASDIRVALDNHVPLYDRTDVDDGGEDCGDH